MDRARIARELVTVARELAAGGSRRKSFLDVSKRLESLRKKYEPTSDEAIFLGMVRDMAVHISRDNWSSVKSLGLDIQGELEAE